jgi:sec-independent protein translocase protein TatB
MARHFTAGIEDMVRQAELEELEKKWQEENERIMRLHPANADYPEPDTMSSPVQPPEPMLPFDETQPRDELPPEQRPLP